MRMIKTLLDKVGIEINFKKGLNDFEIYNELYPQDSIANRRFYNICAGGHFEFGGKFNHPYWTTADVNRPWNKKDRNYDSSKDIAFDAARLEKLPIESNSAELVYSKLTVEHITDEACENLFREIYRILKPGGIVRFISPNSDLYYRAFLHNDYHFYYFRKDHVSLANASIAQLYIDHFAGSVAKHNAREGSRFVSDEELAQLLKEYPFDKAMDKITALCDPEYHLKNRRSHRNWWNFEKYQRKLGETGFNNVMQSCPGQSFAPPMRNLNYFDNYFQKIMIFVEAVKG